MKIQCECGQFQAEILNFPANTPGRCVCYCDDCQTYLHYLGRSDLLDSAGGTEVIPVYPSDFKFLSGEKNLKITRLSPKGMFRFSTTCCNTPIANTTTSMPWAGVIDRAFKVKDTHLLEKQLGPVRSRVMGKFAVGPLPENASKTMGFKDAKVVMPFLLKGFLLGRKKPSPFFKDDGQTPITEPKILSLDERKSILNRIYKRP